MMTTKFGTCIPEAIRSAYGADKYEWNHYKPPNGKVFGFPEKEVFMRRFLDTLFLTTKGNECVNSFLPLYPNYVGKFEYPHEIVDNQLAGEDDPNKIEQSNNCLYLNLYSRIHEQLFHRRTHPQTNQRI